MNTPNLDSIFLQDEYETQEEALAAAELFLLVDKFSYNVEKIRENLSETIEREEDLETILEYLIQPGGFIESALTMKNGDTWAVLVIVDFVIGKEIDPAHYPLLDSFWAENKPDEDPHTMNMYGFKPAELKGA